jgi:benzoyl-CoA reductase subunit D
MIICGCDVGASAVKLVVWEDQSQELLFAHTNKIRQRHPSEVVEACFAKAKAAGFPKEDFAYIAATGEGEAVRGATGYFYSMTCQARGAKHFFPETISVLDLGALHLRALQLDSKGKVLAYKMTSQCASGTGQFLENIARYLGIALEEFAALSPEAAHPQTLSSICVVLAETDIINLVAKGVPLADIMHSIYALIAERALKLLSTLKLESPLTLTGGLAQDRTLVQTLEKRLHTQDHPLKILTHPNSIYAGAIGTALWGGVRYRHKNDPKALRGFIKGIDTAVPREEDRI